jgi:hypothetical protein
MVSHKGALYNDDYRNRGDEYFSDKYQESKTTNASSLATAVSYSVNGEIIELVVGSCCARTQARKYNDRWVNCTGLCTCNRRGHNDKREKGVVGKPGFYVAVYNNGGNKKVGFVKDTLMSEKKARERAGRLREGCGKQTGRRQLVPPVPLPSVPKLQPP